LAQCYLFQMSISFDVGVHSCKGSCWLDFILLDHRVYDALLGRKPHEVGWK
jgi:hypothetical protein